MSGVWGAVVLGSGLSLLVWLMLVCRRPQPPRWLDGTIWVEIGTIVVVACVGFGVALMVDFMVHFEMHAESLEQLAAIVVVLGGLMAAFVVFGVRARLAAYDAPPLRLVPGATEAPTGPRVIDAPAGGEPNPPKSPRGSGSRVRKAA